MSSNGGSRTGAQLDLALLRATALERLRDRRPDLSEMPVEDVKLLVHELEVHQVELEVQNEQLRDTEAKLQEARDRYRDLYECAPVGYLELDRTGAIRLANLRASSLLATERARLIGTRLERLFLREDRDACFRELRAASSTRATRRIALRFRRPDGALRWGELEIMSRDGECRVSRGGESRVGRPLVAGQGLRVTVTDVTERVEAGRALRELQRELEARVAARTARARDLARQLRELTGELGRTEQRERRRAAGILHDHIQQLLVAARMKTEVIESGPIPDELRASLGRVAELLNEAIAGCRSTSAALYPPALHAAGLGVGLSWLASHLREEYGLEVEIDAVAEAEPKSEDVRVLLFECARELLFNVVKHAGVDRAELSLATAGANRVVVEVADAGRGFDPDLLATRQAGDGAFGLFGIQQRLANLGGRMEIESAPGSGTRITLTAPVDAP